jgi:hypothetical protein
LYASSSQVAFGAILLQAAFRADGAGRIFLLPYFLLSGMLERLQRRTSKMCFVAAPISRFSHPPFQKQRTSTVAAFAVNVGDRPTFFLFVAIINYLVYFMYYCEPIVMERLERRG